jgi:hypothetical protein
MLRLAIAGLLSLALSFPAFACEMTVDIAIGMMSANGVKYEVIEDPAKIAVLAAQAQGLTGRDESASKRALLGDFGSHLGVGFEDANGCLTPHPIGLPKPVNA